MTVRLGLVGFGYAGATIHAPLIGAVPQLALSAIATSRPEAVAQAQPGVQCLSDPITLIEATDIDVVVLATPNLSHFPLAEHALRAGKHVVIDKPMVVSSADGKVLIDLAQRHNKVLTVFHNRRWDGDFLTVRKLLQENALGEVHDFESRFDRYRPEVRARWREDDLPGSGLVYDLGSHLIDQALVLFGPPNRLFAQLRMERAGAKAVDAFDVVLDYDQRRARLRAGMMVAQASARYRLEGNGGGFIKYGSDVQEEQLKVGVRPGQAVWGQESDQMFGTLTQFEGDQKTERRVDTLPGSYQVFYEALHRAIDSGAPAPVDPVGANRVIELIEAAIQSDREGRWIELR